jgi:ADP-heptose:LPS heptosyltransferase
VPVNSRFPSRLLAALAGAWRHFLCHRPRRRPENPQRILIAHQLLLGDAIMLTPLIAKLRHNHAAAEIFMLCPPSYAPLYAGQPYGVKVLPFEPRSLTNTAALLRTGGFDWALIPAENRLSWLARAMGARWIVAFDGDPGLYKNYPIDELRLFAAKPKAWGELAAELADGAPPPPYNPDGWPAPPCADFPLPQAPYCVLHVGASTPLKQWAPEKWRELANWIAGQGCQVVWSCGKGEEKLIAAADPQAKFPSYPGNLNLPQLWRLLAQARMVICPDTGVTHLDHLTGTPSIVLYGPGNPAIFGAGEFWRNHPEKTLFIPNFLCRDENLIFRRQLAWGEHCGRTPGACPSPHCMEAIAAGDVIAAANRLLNESIR